MLVSARDQCTIFSNFALTKGFYWKYTLLLKSPVLMHFWLLYKPQPLQSSSRQGVSNILHRCIYLYMCVCAGMHIHITHTHLDGVISEPTDYLLVIILQTVDSLAVLTLALDTSQWRMAIPPVGLHVLHNKTICIHVCIYAILFLKLLSSFFKTRFPPLRSLSPTFLHNSSLCFPSAHLPTRYLLLQDTLSFVEWAWVCSCIIRTSILCSSHTQICERYMYGMCMYMKVVTCTQTTVDWEIFVC